MTVNQNPNSTVQPSEPSLLHSPLLHFVALALIAFLTIKSLDRFGFDYSSVNIGFLAKPQVINLSETELLALLEEHLSEQLEANGIEIAPNSKTPKVSLDKDQHATMVAAIGELIDNAILYDQGIAEGVALNDALIIDRMMKNIETVADKSNCAEESCSAAELTQLLDQAIEIELFESDPVIRRRVIQLMEQQLRRSEVIGHPSDETLQAYIENNPEQFSHPSRISFSQRFFNTREEAENFNQGIISKSRISILPSKVTLASETNIAEQFGSDFAQALKRATQQMQPSSASENALKLPPIKSAFGYHLVTLHEVRPARLAKLHEVYNRAFIKWLEQEKTHSHRRAVARLRNHYQVRTEDIGPVAIARFPSLWLQTLYSTEQEETTGRINSALSRLEIATGSGV